jgi:hypothetical protein
MGLWDRVNDKRKQKKTDTKQNDEIKQLRERVEKAEQGFRGREDGLPMRRDDLGNNFQMSSAMIQREYDEGYGKLGKRFAIGDSKFPYPSCEIRGILTVPSAHRKPTPSPNHRAPTNSHQRPPRCAVQQPPTDPCGPGARQGRLRCRTRKLS